MNTVDAYLDISLQLTDTTIIMWEQELNTSGNSFNFDSQDIYRQYLTNVFLFDFKDRVESNKSTIDRVEKLKKLKENLELMIKIYERNSDFFIQLDRNALRLKKFRETTKSTLSDDDLQLALYRKIEIPERKAYFKSDFYNEVGFLNYDYHYEIYIHSKKLLEDVKTNFDNYENYDNDYLFINNKPLFPMKLIGELHSFLNNLVIEDISEYDFYKEVNILHTINKIKISKDHIVIYYYVIHCMSNEIKDKEIKKKWLSRILQEFGIKRKSYDSKYRHIASSDANETLKEYCFQIDSIFRQ
ncbi:MAG: hypothetical protein Q4G18_12675 [Myroides sp.]|nr:hypothetical protein [Myroides sp.]